MSEEQDKDFEAYLARRATLGRQKGAADELEPPEELDRIVLANAREAIRISHSPPPFKPVRWGLPVGLAATVLLSLAVVLHFGMLSKPAKEAAPVEPKAETRIMADVAVPEEQALAITTPPELEQAPAPAMAARPQAQMKREQAAANAAESLASRAAVAAPPPSAASLPAPSAPAATDTAKPKEDPAAWLRRIAALRAQGKTQDADREWQSFRQAWPDYPVPPDPNP